MTASTPQQKRRSLFLVICFTLISATAQVLFKFGTVYLNQHPTLLGLLTNFSLIGGLALYGIGSAMMILALRHGELSSLYPLISLSYVWVAILSVVIFEETMNPYKVAGIGVIIAGVAVMGNGARK